MGLDALSLPTDYRRRVSALKGQKVPAFGNLGDPLPHVQDPTGSLLVLGAVSADELFHHQEQKGSLFGALTISGHDPLIDFDVDVLSEPIINVMTIPVGVKSARTFYAANLGNAFTVNATGTEPKYMTTALTWDPTSGVSVTSAISTQGNSAVSPQSKERRAFSGTSLVVDSLIAAIYEGIVRAATRARVAEPTLPPQLEAARVEVVVPTLPRHIEAVRVEVAEPTLPAHSHAAKRLRDCADLTASEIADIFGVRRETVQRWIGGGPINRHHAAALNFVDVLFREAIRRIGRAELENWVRMPAMSAPADSPKSPLDLLRAGRFDEVHRLVVSLPDSNGEAGDTELALHRPEYHDDE